MKHITETEFLLNLIKLSNNENKIISIKWMDIKNSPGAFVLIKLMDEKVIGFLYENDKSSKKTSYKLLDFLPNGYIEFNPTIIKKYLKLQE